MLHVYDLFPLRQRVIGIDNKDSKKVFDNVPFQ